MLVAAATQLPLLRGQQGKKMRPWLLQQQQLAVAG
jgi:hypothetical protein